MKDRKEHIKGLVEDFQALRRAMHTAGGSMQTPHVTPSQWIVLMFIEQRKKCSVKDVAQALKITSSAATQLIDGLVKSGYVSRKVHTKDRRAVTLTLSKKTVQQVALMKKRVLVKFVTLFSALNDTELVQYCELNKKIIQKFVSTPK